MEGTLISKAQVWPTTHTCPLRPTSDGRRSANATLRIVEIAAHGGGTSMTAIDLHPLQQGAILAVATGTLLAIGLGRVAGRRLNRALVAVAGGAVTAALEGEKLSRLVRSIDGNVLLLLASLMVVAAGLTEAGAFRYLTFALAARRTTRGALLVAVVAAAGLLSALFLNDTVALMLTPAVVALARRLEAPPLPYLVALAMASNAGSVATPTGNPQNVAVAVASGIGYLPFVAALAPVAVVSLAVVAATVLVVYRHDLGGGASPPRPARSPSVRGRSLTLTLLVAAGMLIAFLLGVAPALAALVAALLTLITAGPSAGKILRQVDFQLLLLFIGLFVVVGALVGTPAAADVLAAATRAGTVALSGLVALASNLLSNVPAVLLFLPAIRGHGGTTPALTLAMASTLAGNTTLVASIANLIVAETGRRLGVEIGFLEYARVGVPVTLATLVLGALWLVVR